MKKTIGFVFSHTHWDIEWYLPLRSYRFWLVDLLDRLLHDCARRRDFKTFVLDGQVAPVDLYLAVKPEQAPAIRRLVRNGKLAVGPFYTQFDEWLNSPEAMVRNCLYGKERARELGKIMLAGYLPDNFGHPWQLPQILKGFGLDSLIFMRGMPDKPRGMKDEFFWEGLDGTKVLCVHLTGTYANALLFNEAVNFPQVPQSSPYGDLFFRNECVLQSTLQCDVAQGAQKLINVARRFRRNHPSGVVPLANGLDHVPPVPQIGAIIAEANRRQGAIHFQHGNCAELVELVKKSGRKFPVWRGELYGARYHYLLTGTLSTRSYLKQSNFQVETLLEKYAEPLAAIAALQAQPYPEKLLREAWGLMFLNQAHDSIHGSSVDPVHLEMMQRFAAARQIATGIAQCALEHLGSLFPAGPGDTRRQIIVYHPFSAGAGQGAVELFVRVPSSDFHIEDQAGNKLPLQIVPTADPAPFGATHRVLFLSPRAGERALEAFALVPGRLGASSAFKNSSRRIENEFLQVTFRNGALALYDKVTGRRYKDLNILEDEADAGDAWDFSPPWRKNKTYRSSEFSARCRLIEDGPLRATLLVETVMRVPRRLDGQKRSRELLPQRFSMRISLLSGARRVMVALEMDNSAQDHRLRLKCRTGIRSRTIKSQGHFAIIERPLAYQAAGKDWAQPPPRTFPFREWLAVDDGRRGLAVAVSGLYEYEARSTAGGVDLYVTLLRGIGQMSRAKLRTRAAPAGPQLPTPEAQCLGSQRFEYALVPYDCAAPGNRAPFLPEVNAFLYPPLVHWQNAQTALRPEEFNGQLFDLAPENLLISCFKRAQDGDGFILRFWENEGRAALARLTIAKRFTKVFLCNLNEEVLKHLPRDGESIKLPVKPYKIITLKLKLRKES